MEFDLISRHFKAPFANLVQSNGKVVLAGIGDDCAALQPSPGHVLFVSTDTLVENVHFFADDPAHLVGWKSLACNLSDLAACGASPLGFTLNLSLPKVDEIWLTGFSTGLLEGATRFNCPLVGGDTTSAGVNTVKTVSITVFGQAPSTHKGFHRAHAQSGDQLWVSGIPGLARLGLLLEYQRRGQLYQHCKPADLQAMDRVLAAMPDPLQRTALGALQQPVPRLGLGVGLRGLARACVDLSDGLGGDVAHIAQASGLSAILSISALMAIWRTCWPALDAREDAEELLDTLVAVTLQGGDDFELCWTAHPNNHDAIQSLKSSLHCVGEVASGEGVWLLQPGCKPTRLISQSYNHFAEPTR